MVRVVRAVRVVRVVRVVTLVWVVWVDRVVKVVGVVRVVRVVQVVQVGAGRLGHEAAPVHMQDDQLLGGGEHAAAGHPGGAATRPQHRLGPEAGHEADLDILPLEVRCGRGDGEIASSECRHFEAFKVESV